MIQKQKNYSSEPLTTNSDTITPQLRAEVSRKIDCKNTRTIEKCWRYYQNLHILCCVIFVLSSVALGGTSKKNSIDFNTLRTGGVI